MLGMHQHLGEINLLILPQMTISGRGKVTAVDIRVDAQVLLEIDEASFGHEVGPPRSDQGTGALEGVPNMPRLRKGAKF